MGQSNCEICGKPLSNFVSVKLGIGPICRRKEGQQMTLPFENHAEYEIKTANSKFIYIEDLGHNQFKTVTNDVEFILARLKENYEIENQRIFYRDSSGDIDEIVHKKGVFKGFKHGHDGYNTDIVIGKSPLPNPAKKKHKSLDDDFGR
jgi:hypothetical protein